MDSDGAERRVGLLYDKRMLGHFMPDGSYHSENPDRIKAIWNKLERSGITKRCVLLKVVSADDQDILDVHSAEHAALIKSTSSIRARARSKLANKLDDVYFNEASSECAYLAAGSAIEVARRVANGEFNFAVAIIIPPGHHAEHDKPRGFCLLNNVAIAATYLLKSVKKILIVDWDVHHENGTQKKFIDDRRVLFFSVHRHDAGNFYPTGDEGFYDKIGQGDGIGYNINVPWETSKDFSIGDSEYFAVWEHILLPVAKEFNPDIILISAGFDAAAGDPLGKCYVTPFGFSHMLKKLMELAEGKIVMLLEGGYDLDSIVMSMHACLEVLLEDKPLVGSSEACPLPLSIWHVIQAVHHKFKPYWTSLTPDLPPNPGYEVKIPKDEGGEKGMVSHLVEQLERILLKQVNILADEGTATHREVSEIKLLLTEMLAEMKKGKGEKEVSEIKLLLTEMLAEMKKGKGEKELV